MRVEQTGSRAVGIQRRNGWRTVVVAVVTVLVTLSALGWWASSEGYVSWFGTACTDDGYDPIPSYDELVFKFNESPYCARRIRNETWF